MSFGAAFFGQKLGSYLAGSCRSGTWANECGSAAKFSTILYFPASRLLRGHLQKAVFDAPGMAMQLTQLVGGGAICAARKSPIQWGANVLLYLKMHGWSHAPHLASWEAEWSCRPIIGRTFDRSAPHDLQSPSAGPSSRRSDPA